MEPLESNQPLSTAYNWKHLAVRGALAIGFGLAALLVPGVTLSALIMILAVFAMVDGALSLLSGLASSQRGVSAVTLEGIFGIALGAFAFVLPTTTAYVVALVVAAWAIVTGGLELAAAVKLREKIHGEILLGLSGAASVALGVALLIAPTTGITAITWLIGAYALVSGATLLTLGLRLKHLQEAPAHSA